MAVTLSGTLILRGATEFPPAQGVDLEMMQYGSGYGNGYGGMMDGGWFLGFLWLLVLLAVFGAVVVVVVWMVRSSSAHGQSSATPPPSSAATPPGGAGHDEAVAIAKRRLASGEITTEQYAEIMRHLGG